MKDVCRGVDSPALPACMGSQLNLKQPEGIFRQTEVGAAERELSAHRGPFSKVLGLHLVALTASAALTHYLS